MRKILATLSLAGLLAGCSHEKPKEIELLGSVQDSPRILLSNSLLRPNSLYLTVQLDCNRGGSCEDLDPTYHGENGVFKSIRTQLETGDNIPNIHKGDRVHFVLSEGFTESGRSEEGPVYWVNISPARGRLLGYIPKDE